MEFDFFYFILFYFESRKKVMSGLVVEFDFSLCILFGEWEGSDEWIQHNIIFTISNL